MHNRDNNNEAMDHSRPFAQELAQESVCEDADPDQLQPSPDTLFSAILTPHRSLGRGGFRLLMAAVVLVSLAAGIAFVRAGAWPVTGFLALDAVLIWWAFRINYRDGRLYETVDLTGNTLTVRRFLPSGRMLSWTFNPYWARCRLTQRRGRAGELSLTSHGRTLVFGAFLSPDEKADFAAALAGALQEARGGVRI